MSSDKIFNSFDLDAVKIFNITNIKNDKATQDS